VNHEVSIPLCAAFVLALAVAPVFRGPDAARAAEVTIDTGNFWFCDPSFQGGICHTTIQVGDTVTWSWLAGTHTTTECGADCDNPTATPLWDAPLDSANPTFSRTFDMPGTYLYLCSFHPILMRGRIIVEEVSPTPTLPPAETPTPSPTPIPTLPTGTPIAETPVPVAETTPPATPVRTQEPSLTPLPTGPEVIGVPPAGAGSTSGRSWPWWPLVAAGAVAAVGAVLLAYQGRRAKP
jgi:plastocyanin